MENFDLSQLQNLLKKPQKSRNMQNLKKILGYLKFIPFFTDLRKDLPFEEVLECFRCLQCMSYSGNDLICKQGECVEHVFIVLHGKVVYENIQGEFFKDFEPGLVFAEDLLDQGRIDFCIRSFSNNTVLAYYCKEDYKKCLGKYREEKKIALVNFLCVQKVFNKWPKGLLIFWTSCLTEKKYEKGEIVFSRLESPDKVLILYEGELMLIGKTVKRLRSGEMLGFEELKNQEKYSSTCVVTQKSTVLVLCKFDFFRILPQLNPNPRAYLKTASRSRKIFSELTETKTISPSKVLEPKFKNGLRRSVENFRTIVPIKSIFYSGNMIRRRSFKSASSLRRLFN